MASEKTPWNRSVLYQVYPWSFNEDEQREQRGNGSIKGITEKLEYIQEEAGNDAIWISPPYDGPMHDAGYDISDFGNIHPDLGTLEDFDELLHEAHERNMKVILDFIPNHSSTEHEWFQKSRAGDPEYKDWYIWNAGKTDENGDLVMGDDGRPLPPNNWGSVFSKPQRRARDMGMMPHLQPDELTPYTSAWQWDEERGEYYNRTFVKEQADLNWDNPKVREAILNYKRFWLQRGLDGFRVDAVNHIAKNPRLVDEAMNPDYREAKHNNPYDRLDRFQSCNFPSKLYPTLEMMNDVLREERAKGRDVYQLYESYAPAEQLYYMNRLDPEVASTFNFSVMRSPRTAASRKEAIDWYFRNLPDGAVPNHVNGNHDNTRIASEMGDLAARSMGMLNLMLPGMRIVYSSEELGLHDGDVPWHLMQDKNGLRDGARTPILWNDTLPNAGFSNAHPNNLWLPVNWNDAHLSVERQRRDSKSTLAMYSAASRLCKELPALRDGRYVETKTDNEQVYAFARSTGGDFAFVLTNFSDRPQVARVYEALSLALKPLLSSVDVEDSHRRYVNLRHGVELQPHESLLVAPGK